MAKSRSHEERVEGTLIMFGDYQELQIGRVVSIVFSRMPSGAYETNCDVKARR